MARDLKTPINGEPIITKNYPNAFIQTDLDQRLKAQPSEYLLTGFMTHICINSTAHRAFNLGYAATVVANATATRALQTASGEIVSEQQMQAAALVSTRDLHAVVVEFTTDLAA